MDKNDYPPWGYHNKKHDLLLKLHFILITCLESSNFTNVQYPKYVVEVHPKVAIELTATVIDEVVHIFISKESTPAIWTIPIKMKYK